MGRVFCPYVSQRPIRPIGIVRPVLCAVLGWLFGGRHGTNQRRVAQGKKGTCHRGKLGYRPCHGQAMLRRGMHVVITGRDQARGDEAAAKLTSFGNAWFAQADAADETAVGLPLWTRPSSCWAAWTLL